MRALAAVMAVVASLSLVVTLYATGWRAQRDAAERRASDLESKYILYRGLLGEACRELRRLERVTSACEGIGDAW